MSFTLKLEQIDAVRNRPGGVLLAVMMNQVLMPLLAWLLTLISPGSPWNTGLILVGIVPSTLASASVWTRKAAGNDAVPLLVTLITNGACFITIPAWLFLLAGQQIDFPVQKLMGNLLLVACLPMLLGQVLRLYGSLGEFADQHRSVFSTVAQWGILAIITLGSARSAPILYNYSNDFSFLSWLMMLSQCLVLHGVPLWLGWKLMHGQGLQRPTAVGVMFSGSQKTLPITIELATSPLLLAAGISPLAILPPLIFHTSQLILDTLVLDWIKIRV